MKRRIRVKNFDNSITVLEVQERAKDHLISLQTHKAHVYRNRKYTRKRKNEREKIIMKIEEKGVGRQLKIS